MTGCSVESLDSGELLTANASFKAQINANQLAIPSGICAGEPAEFCLTAAAGSNVQVQQWNGADWVQVYQASRSAINPCFSLEFPVAGDYQLRYKIGAGGFVAPVTVTVVDCTDCEENFSYTTNGGNNYTFFYTPEKDMVDANLVFTFAQSVAISGLNTWSNSGQTMQKSMNLDACTTYQWTVELARECSGNSQNSNVWTDFNVDGVSKKNSATPNITQSCN